MALFFHDLFLGGTSPLSDRKVVVAGRSYQIQKVLTFCYREGLNLLQYKQPSYLFAWKMVKWSFPGCLSFIENKRKNFKLNLVLVLELSLVLKCKALYLLIYFFSQQNRNWPHWTESDGVSDAVSLWRLRYVVKLTCFSISLPWYHQEETMR